jgi:hypothetical protein
VAAEIIMEQILRGGDDNLISFNKSVGVGALTGLGVSVVRRGLKCLG